MRTRLARSATVAGKPASTADRMASVVAGAAAAVDSVGRGWVMPVILRATDPRTPVAKNPTNTPAPEAGADDAAPDTTSKAGKGAPTPSRAEQEAARKRPLVPNDRKEAAKQARAKQAEARERARVGMAAGDDRYLPDARPRSAEEVRARLRRRAVQHRRGAHPGDVRSSSCSRSSRTRRCRRSASSPCGRSSSSPWSTSSSSASCVTRKLKAKFGEDKAERVRWYAAMRALQLRPLRLPKPQVKRGQYPS